MTDRSSTNGQTAGQLENWSREGFTGEATYVRRAHYAPDFIRAEGPLAPRRLTVGSLHVPDATDPQAFPVPVAAASSGLRVSVSHRGAPMPFVVRNVEADELHFVQRGELRFRTAVGIVDATAGDFVCIPRSIAYRIEAVTGDLQTVVVEAPGALRFDTPARSGMVNFNRDVSYARFEPTDPGGETTLILRSGDEFTRFVYPHDPLAATERVGGSNPVWKLNLAKVSPITYEGGGGPPAHFLGIANNEVLFYPLSARRGGRPVVHVNADYDEMIYYFAGPGAWGAVSEPGTLTWVPKGVTHHGPPEDVPGGYLAWMLETRTTLRFTPQGLAVAELMETGMYGPHRRPEAVPATR
jgi:homogentisate 1,2-dioxygenase